MALSNAHRAVTSSGVVPGAPAAAEDGQVFKAYPTLQSWLLETVWEDGKKRVPSSLLIFADGGAWKAMLNDRDAGRVAFVTGQAVRDLLVALEKGLAQSSLDWRPSRDGQAKSTKRG